MRIPLKTISIKEQSTDTGIFGTKQITTYWNTEKQLVEAFTVPKNSILSTSVGQGKFPENNSPEDEVIYTVANSANVDTVNCVQVFDERNRIYIHNENGGTFSLRPFDLSNGKYLSSEQFTLSWSVNQDAISMTKDPFDNQLVTITTTGNRIGFIDLEDESVSLYNPGLTQVSLLALNEDNYYFFRGPGQLYGVPRSLGTPSLITDAGAWVESVSSLLPQHGFVVDSVNNKFYFTDSGDKIFVGTLTTGLEGTHITITGSSTPSLTKLKIDIPNQIIYVVDAANDSIVIYDIAKGTQGVVSTTFTITNGTERNYELDNQGNLIFIEV